MIGKARAKLDVYPERKAKEAEDEQEEAGPQEGQDGIEETQAEVEATDVRDIAPEDFWNKRKARGAHKEESRKRVIKKE